MLRQTATRELGDNSRDLTAKVRQVREILPQCSDDQSFCALVECDEDVMRAVEVLLLSGPKPQTGKKKAKEKESKKADAASASPAADAVGASVAASSSFVDAAPPADTSSVQPAEKQEDVEEEPREKTAADREMLKLRKKLNDITRIEESLAAGKKLDPLQLPKLEKKGELLADQRRVEKLVQEEAAERARLRKEERAEKARIEEERRLEEQKRLAEDRRIEEERRAEEARRFEEERIAKSRVAHEEFGLQQQEQWANRPAKAAAPRGDSAAHNGPPRTGGSNEPGQTLLALLHGQQVPEAQWQQMPAPQASGSNHASADSPSKGKGCNGKGKGGKGERKGGKSKGRGEKGPRSKQRSEQRLD